MHLFVQTVALGVFIGGVYALMAVGLSLIFGVLRIVNFAHGELAMLGSYGAVLSASALGLSPYIGLVAAFLVGAVVGYITNALFLRPVFQGNLERPGEFAIIVTFILSQLFLGAALILFGTRYRHFPDFWSADLNLGGWIHVSGDRVFAFAAAVVLIGALMWLVYFSDTGRAWRALTQQRQGAQVIGIDIMRYSNLAFAVGSGLAGVAAGMLAALYFVYPSSGNTVLVKSFIVVIIGGMGSIWGALWGGLALGLIETLGSVYVSSSYVDAYGFVLMIVVLLIAPQGLFGRKVRAV